MIGVQRTILEGSFPFAAPAHVTDVGFVYTYHGINPNAGVVGLGGWINAFGEQWMNIPMTAVVEGDEEQLNLSLSLDITTSLDFDIQTAHEEYGGNGALVAITLHGTGEPPTFLEAMGWTACE